MPEAAREDQAGGADDSEDERESHFTRRLRLRAPRAADAAALAIAVGNPRVAMSLFDVPYPYERADAEGWIERARVPSKAPGTTLVALQLASGELVGAGFHRPSDIWPGGFDLSFWVAEPFWGQGFGTEIAHAVVDNAFEEGRAERLWCAIRVTSAPARRVAEKCGFQFRDTGLVRSLASRGTVPVERFVLERRVWASLKAWGNEGRGNEARGHESRGNEGRGNEGRAPQRLQAGERGLAGRDRSAAKTEGDASDAA